MARGYHEPLLNEMLEAETARVIADGILERPVVAVRILRIIRNRVPGYRTDELVRRFLLTNPSANALLAWADALPDYRDSLWERAVYQGLSNRQLIRAYSAHPRLRTLIRIQLKWDELNGRDVAALMEASPEDADALWERFLYWKPSKEALLFFVYHVAVKQQEALLVLVTGTHTLTSRELLDMMERAADTDLKDRIVAKIFRGDYNDDADLVKVVRQVMDHYPDYADMAARRILNLSPSSDDIAHIIRTVPACSKQAAHAFFESHPDAKLAYQTLHPHQPQPSA
jgi:hypothetical protein